MNTTILLAIATSCLGAFLGALGNKLVRHDLQSNWKWIFYVFGISSILLAIIACKIFFFQFNGFIWDFETYFSIILLLISGIALTIFTAKVLDKKSIYSTSELDPIIRQFTEGADHNEIRLFGGDLNFFGNGPSEMDRNNQYMHLRGLGFNKVLILCEEPKNSSTKIRYGKILNELNGVELRFYNPDIADLQIRGRMKTLQGVEKLLIYSKIASRRYQTIETDTANSHGALLCNIWKLVWSLAKIEKAQIDDCIERFRQFNTVV